jgi:hypothetical protein
LLNLLGADACMPVLCRQLYPTLLIHADCVGVWHKAGAGPRGALYSFRWADSGIDVCELVPSRRYFTHITHKKLCTLNPSNLRYQAAVIDDTKCILRDYGIGFASAASCAVAEAAACVAAGGASSSRTTSSSDGGLGGSPTSSSWGAELLRFMKQSVQKVRQVELLPNSMHRLCQSVWTSLLLMA